jgi:predicted  nucleic acid-binding Zn-ribbon protein
MPLNQCPACGESFRGYPPACPECGVELFDEPDEERDEEEA